MALVLADRVKETTTSTGTTAITLAGAATGYQTFSSAVGNANTTYYTVADQTGANWEVGIGTYTTSGNTLSRDTVLASSNAGSLVTFTAGTKDVFVTYPAERALYTGGPLGTPTSGTLTNCTFPTLNQNTTGTAATATNLASGSAGTIPYQTASGTTAMLAVGTTGQVLTSNGAAAPTWATASGGGGTATGTSYTNPTAAGTAAAAFGSGSSAATLNSIAVGYQCSTAGSYAAAFGYIASAVGLGSTAIGANTVSTPSASTSIGCNSGYGGSVTATGSGAMALGGSYASGTDSFAAAIGNNTSSYGATGANSIVLGRQSNATNYAMAVGYTCVASASNACALGASATASGTSSVAVGQNVTASGSYSFASGFYTVASGSSSVALGTNSYSKEIGKYSFGNASSQGYQQAGKIVLRAATTTTTAVALTSDGNAASTNNQLIVAGSQAMAIQGTLIAKQSGSGNMAAYNITGAVSNNGGTMAVTGLALTLIGSDSIGLGASPTIAVDNTNKGVTITSGYKSATTIHWVATVNTSEVTV
jgi:hypothetical protein